MNICVYSEQKSLLSVRVLLTFPAAGFQMTPCSLGRCMGLFVRPVESIYGLGRVIGENAGAWPMFSPSTPEPCYTTLRESAWGRVKKKQRLKHDRCMQEHINILYGQLDNNRALAVIFQHIEPFRIIYSSLRIHIS